MTVRLLRSRPAERAVHGTGDGEPGLRERRHLAWRRLRGADGVAVLAGLDGRAEARQEVGRWRA